eukprot:7369063-Prymnesium_polylepis.1
MRHASYTRKTWTPRYVPRGGVPFRNVTSTRRRTGSQRAEPNCPAQRACGSTQQRGGRPPRRTVT